MRQNSSQLTPRALRDVPADPRTELIPYQSPATLRTSDPETLGSLVFHLRLKVNLELLKEPLHRSLNYQKPQERACAQAPKQRDVPVGSSPSAPEREEDAGVCQRLLLGKQGRYLWKVVCWWPPSSQEGEPASEKIAQRHLGRCGRARKIRTMPHSSDSSDSSFSRSPPPGKQDSSDDVRKVQRREKNRIAAQKSRQRQTQKADTLHLESEDLEKQNAALRKEIKQLTEELKYFTSVLSSHEPLCSVLASGTPSPPEVVYSAHAFHQPHISSPRFQP